jgi:hypothetical protein
MLQKTSYFFKQRDQDSRASGSKGTANILRCHGNWHLDQRLHCPIGCEATDLSGTTNACYYSGVQKYSTTPTLPPTILLAENHQTR